MTPACTHTGLGSSAFARRYLRNRCFFLFLRVLRCFSSPGSPRIAMYLPYAACGLRMRVSPFGHPRIAGYVRLPAAFRSLSRPSSASSAWAFALRPFSLDLTLLFSLPSAVFTASDCFSSKFYLSMSLLFLSFACFAVYAVFKVRRSLPRIPSGLLPFLFWRPPILPHRLQCSTFGRLRLNRRVRDGNGCFPQSYRRQIFELLIAQQ